MSRGPVGPDEYGEGFLDDEALEAEGWAAGLDVWGPLMKGPVRGVTCCQGYDLRSGHPCGRLAVDEPAILGCVHEHVGPRWLCPLHLADVRIGNHRCGDCAEAGCPCRLQMLAASA